MDKDQPKTEIVAALECVFDSITLAIQAAKDDKSLTEQHRRVMDAQLRGLREQVTQIGHHAYKAGEVWAGLVADGQVSA